MIESEKARLAQQRQATSQEDIYTPQFERVRRTGQGPAYNWESDQTNSFSPSLFPYDPNPDVYGYPAGYPTTMQAAETSQSLTISPVPVAMPSDNTTVPTSDSPYTHQPPQTHPYPLYTDAHHDPPTASSSSYYPKRESPPQALLPPPPPEIEDYTYLPHHYPESSSAGPSRRKPERAARGRYNPYAKTPNRGRKDMGISSLGLAHPSEFANLRRTVLKNNNGQSIKQDPVTVPYSAGPAPQNEISLPPLPSDSKYPTVFPDPLHSEYHLPEPTSASSQPASRSVNSIPTVSSHSRPAIPSSATAEGGYQYPGPGDDTPIVHSQPAQSPYDYGGDRITVPSQAPPAPYRYYDSYIPSHPYPVTYPTSDIASSSTVTLDRIPSAQQPRKRKRNEAIIDVDNDGEYESPDPARRKKAKANVDSTPKLRWKPVTVATPRASKQHETPIQASFDHAYPSSNASNGPMFVAPADYMRAVPSQSSQTIKGYAGDSSVVPPQTHPATYDYHEQTFTSQPPSQPQSAYPAPDAAASSAVTLDHIPPTQRSKKEKPTTKVDRFAPYPKPQSRVSIRINTSTLPAIPPFQQLTQPRIITAYLHNIFGEILWTS